MGGKNLKSKNVTLLWNGFLTFVCSKQRVLMYVKIIITLLCSLAHYKNNSNYDTIKKISYLHVLGMSLEISIMTCLELLSRLYHSY